MTKKKSITEDVASDIINEPTTPGTGESTTGFLNLFKLRLDQDFEAGMGVEKVLNTVHIGRPSKHNFFRIDPRQDYQLTTGVLIHEEEGKEVYLVDPALRPALIEDIVPVVLFTGLTRQEDIFLLPVRLPGPDGRQNEWHTSLFEAAKIAMTGWIRVVANKMNRCYDVYRAKGDLLDPTWPKESFKHILEVAFRDRYITSLDHVVIRKLRGEV
jgi:hypothetical protein